MRVVISEDLYLRCRTDLALNAVLLVTGQLEVGRNSGEPLFRATDVQPLDSITKSRSETATQ